MYFGFLLNTNQVLYSTKLLQFFQVFFFFCLIFFIFFVEITKKRVCHLQISPSPHGLKLTVKQNVPHSKSKNTKETTGCAGGHALIVSSIRMMLTIPQKAEWIPLLRVVLE